ncbi:unnamed protein product [Symbiodinium natans]|uniref:Uncharacterized protein n=1 Tax=Symbiodinium natans TaxID=878477 RepID=A0A812SNV7_9DINO|nr:unnamed protein product [Symbiodinium natans]
MMTNVAAARTTDGQRASMASALCPSCSARHSHTTDSRLSRDSQCNLFHAIRACPLLASQHNWLLERVPQFGDDDLLRCAALPKVVRLRMLMFTTGSCLADCLRHVDKLASTTVVLGCRSSEANVPGRLLWSVHLCTDLVVATASRLP